LRGIIGRFNFAKPVDYEKRFNGPMKEVCSYINSQNITPEDVLFTQMNIHLEHFVIIIPTTSIIFTFLPTSTDTADMMLFHLPAPTVRTSKNFIDGREKIWFVEREGSDMSKQGSKLLDKHILQSRGMILKFNLYPHSFYAVTLRRVVPGNALKD